MASARAKRLPKTCNGASKFKNALYFVSHCGTEIPSHSASSVCHCSVPVARLRYTALHWAFLRFRNASCLSTVIKRLCWSPNPSSSHASCCSPAARRRVHRFAAGGSARAAQVLFSARPACTEGQPPRPLAFCSHGLLPFAVTPSPALDAATRGVLLEASTVWAGERLRRACQGRLQRGSAFPGLVAPRVRGAPGWLARSLHCRC